VSNLPREIPCTKILRVHRRREYADATIPGTAYTKVPRDHAIPPARGAQGLTDATLTSRCPAQDHTCHVHFVRDGDLIQVNPAQTAADRVRKTRDRTITSAEPTQIHACPLRDFADPILEIANPRLATADREI
jgi:hypothetical protein